MPIETRAAFSMSGSLSSIARMLPSGCTSRMPTICEAMLPSAMPVPWVPVVSAPASAWLSISPWLIIDRPFALSALPSVLIVVPAWTETRLRAVSMLVMPCRPDRVRCSPEVSATGVNEWPEPAQRTFMPPIVASRTICASAASLSGAPLCRTMQD